MGSLLDEEKIEVTSSCSDVILCCIVFILIDKALHSADFLWRIVSNCSNDCPLDNNSYGKIKERINYIRQIAYYMTNR